VRIKYKKAVRTCSERFIEQNLQDFHAMLKKILLLEHDEDDAYLTVTVFRELGIKVELVVVDSQDELFAVLKESVTRQTALPSMVLLNYHTIPAGALEIIRSLKTDDVFRRIPLVVGCGVADNKIVSACYSEGVSSFIKKPETTSAIEKSILDFINYWSDVVLLPS
jgi:response regulator RpfG family c-di-GMP phosphodiesterase